MQQPNIQTNKNKRLEEKKTKKKTIWLLQFETEFHHSQYYLLCCLLFEASKKPQKRTTPTKNDFAPFEIFSCNTI